MRMDAVVPIAVATLSTPYIGVPLNVLVACVAGAYASFSFGDQVEPRSKMFNLFVACVIMGSATTGVVNYTLEAWRDATLDAGAQAGIGAIVSCLTRFWLPSLIDYIGSGEWKRLIPFGNRGVRKDGDT